MIRIELPEEWRREVCVVREVTAEELDAHFTAEERQRIESFPREKRRAEWSASRLALKLLSTETGLCDTARECVSTSAYRRPALELRGRLSELQISITHSEGAGGAAISKERIGIDLQKIRPLAERATKFFLSRAEVDMWRALDLEDSLIHLWCAKEAGYKLHALPGWYKGVQVDLEAAHPEGLCLRYRDPRSEGTIETRRIGDDFILAVAKMEGALPRP
ncbi:MAG TPA: 4'-phosphopantetheinyl transferase superfamily protein [Thermoanaerobaculia bacterium]|nr:4'-phosphopantetheinyl transferase superfamily protein [Thermoanaerobaculia bacterium]